MKKRTLQLPRGYISYSQIQLWKSDKSRYKEVYFNGRHELGIRNSGMDFGSVVATALENDEKTGDLLTDIAMELLPKYDIRDKEITTNLETKDAIIPLVGRPDTLDSKTFDFREYKTGKIKWTQSKAQSSPQMKFYAMLIYLQHGKITKEAYLDWIETANTPDGIKPTGHVESFKVELSLSDILTTMSNTAAVAKEIESEWATYEPPAEIPW